MVRPEGLEFSTFWFVARRVGRKMPTLVDASDGNAYDATLCFGLETTPRSMSH